MKFSEVVRVKQMPVNNNLRQENCFETENLPVAAKAPERKTVLHTNSQHTVCLTDNAIQGQAVCLLEDLLIEKMR